MPKILVITSNPLMAFGGHLVIAEALVDALNGRRTRLKRLEQLDGLPRGGPGGRAMTRRSADLRGSTCVSPC